MTGGEPLLQKDTPALLQALLDAGHRVLLETGGHRSIEAVPEAVHVIMDMKPPSSGETAKNLAENIGRLLPHHEVKFVLADRADYDWAVDQLRKHSLDQRVHAVLLSPAWGHLEPRTLVDWMLEDHLPARLNLQIHKVIWGPDKTGV